MDDEKKTVDPVPYFIHEGMVTRMAECNKRLLIALVIAVIPATAMAVWKMNGAENPIKQGGAA